ncbi:MAG: ABC transporter substrate-binding protein [Alphaproteobacteria bacterium]|nr:ABC transporter substrate-binding protein [Alphaproteobacteria bacterium]
MTILSRGRRIALAASALAGAMTLAFPSAAQTLRAVMHSDLKILDPIWTTAYIVRNHGYMIYDTLLAVDEKFAIKPQMLEKWSVSDDKLTYTFTLRDGLEWHDGQPVTSEDCIASIKRWGAKDSMGQKLMGVTKELKQVDAKSFQLVLKEPYGLVIDSLAKPSSNVPFMMPKRVADGDPNKQLEDTTGSGPFIFKKDEWKPGEKVVYVKNPKYKPRSEPASGLAGGKVVKVDRVEWIAIADQQTAINALIAGEIDYMEAPTHDLLPIVAKEKDLKIVDWNPAGLQYTMRFNVLHKPFDNPKIRAAIWYAFNQEDFLKAAIGDPKYYKVCKAMFVCGTPLASDAGMEDKLGGNIAKAKQLLQEAGYDGTPVVMMQSTDIQLLTNLAPVGKAAMEKAGFKVDMQSMDWQTLVARRAKKDPPGQGGWNVFFTAWVAADILNPVMAGFFNASCDKAMFGWPCDAELEKLRDQFSRESDPGKQKTIVDAVQRRVADYPTHIHLGQFYLPSAVRKNIDGILIAPVPVLWNVTKK